MGGKHRVGKKIAAVVGFYEPVHYHEPFCGMFGVGKHVDALCVTASDVHQDLIAMLKAVRDGWEGPEYIHEPYWRELKYADWHHAIRAYVGFGCSFGGKFFGNPARDPKNGHGVEYFAARMRRSMQKLRPLIQGVSFDCHSYLEYKGQADVLYCDPPYADTSGYSQGKFNPAEFWDWVEKQSKNRVVLVSELKCPENRGIKSVLDFPLKYTVNREKPMQVMERIFTFN